MSVSDDWHALPPGLRTDVLDGDRVVLVSTGIDIGSSTMHMALSRLVAERNAGGFAIVAREVLHESPVLLTPYVDGSLIDAAAVAAAFEGHYRVAGIRPEQVDTGVVILTGVALDRDNARAIGDMLGRWGGQLLSVAAGDRLEGVLAAHGSGAVARSRGGRTVLNVDVGGGTTKVSTCHDGRVEAVLAFDVGSRLIAWDPTSRVVQRLEPSGRALAKAAAVPVEVGEPFAPEDEARLTGAVARSLVALLSGDAEPGLVAATARQERATVPAAGSPMVISGGLSEYLGGRETEQFGDLGPGLAAALERELSRRAAPYTTAGAGIRATAIGAGQFSVQVSGITIHRSPGFPLPLRDVPVAALPGDLLEEQVSAEHVADAVQAALALLEAPQTPQEGPQPVALALPWTGSALHSRLRATAAGLVAGAAELLRAGAPLLVLVDGDVARLLGRVLQEVLPGTPLLVIDGIQVAALHFIDVGEQVGSGGPIPVTVKSLAFRS